MTHQSDSASTTDLVHRVKAGDGEAFGILVERFHNVVHAVALAQTRNAHNADDVTQETFLRAFQSIKQIRDPSRVEHWLVVIARNVARSIARRTAKSTALDSAEAEQIPADSPDASRNEMKAFVRESMRHLKPRQREVLFLHYFAGMSTQEIAQSLEISRHAAKKRLERARTALGEHIVRALDGIHEPAESRSARIQKLLGVVAVDSALEFQSLGFVHEIQTSYRSLCLFAVKSVVTFGAVASLFVVSAIWYEQKETRELSLNDAGFAQRASNAEPTPRNPRPPQPAQTAEAVPFSPTDTPPEPAHQNLPEETRTSPLRRELPGMTPTLQSKLDSEVSIVFDDEYIGTILEFVSGYTNINIAIDWRALEPEPRRPETFPDVTGYVQYDVPPRIIPLGGFRTDGYVAPFQVTDMPASDVLFQFLEPMGLSYVAQPGFMMISTPDKLVSVPPIPQDRLETTYKAADSIDALISMTFEGGHLSDALLSLRTKVNQTGFVVDWQVVQPPDRPMWVKSGEEAKLYESIDKYDAEGFVPVVKIDSGRLGECFTAMLRTIGLSFVPMHDFIWVSSIKRIESEAPVLTVPSGISEHMRSVLDDTELSVEFDNEPLTNILDILSGWGTVNVPIEVDDSVDVAELKIPFVKMDDVPLRSILFVLLRPVDLDYEVREDTIAIISRP